MTDPVRALRWLLAITLLVPLLPARAKSAAPNKATVDLSQVPELDPEVALPRIVQGLRRFLKDPQSINDFALCTPPRKIKFEAGRPVRWTYLFSLNAKSDLGGFSGLKPYGAVLYADGRTTISSLFMPGSDGFSKFANDLIERDMRRCAFLPHDKLRSLLDENL